VYTGGLLSGDTSITGTRVMAQFQYYGDPTTLNGTYSLGGTPFVFGFPWPYTSTFGFSITVVDPTVTFKNGVITSWLIQTLSGIPNPEFPEAFGSIATSFGNGPNFPDGDSVVLACQDPFMSGFCNGVPQGYSSGPAGTWSVRPFPLPATLPLLAAGLSLFGWLARRRLAA
jgi:hypothetical protein